MRPKPKVGQILYSLNVGNAARHTEQKLTPVVVKNVGSKYFKAGQDGGDWSNRKYFIDSWEENSNYSTTSVLYEAEQEWLSEKEKAELFVLIRNRFGWDAEKKITLEKLRAIKKILEGE